MQTREAYRPRKAAAMNISDAQLEACDVISISMQQNKSI